MEENTELETTSSAVQPSGPSTSNVRSAASLLGAPASSLVKGVARLGAL